MASRNAINVLIKLLGGDEMVAELEKLGKTGEKAFKEIEGAANKVSVAKLGGALNAFGKDFATVAQRASLAVTGIVAGVAAAAPAVVMLANAGAKAADEIGKAAQATGLQTDAYQKLAFAAEQAGAGQEQFATAMSRFNQEIVESADKAAKATAKMGRDIRQGAGYTVEALSGIGVTVTRFGDEIEGAGKKASKGAKQTQTAFQQLGISVRDSAGRLKTTEQLLLEVADAFKRMPDGARKSALAVALFGREGAKLIPLLNEGADGVRRFMEEAERLGIVFTPEQIKAASDYQDALGELSAAANRLRQQIGLIFVPALTQAARAFRDIILRNRDAILSFASGAVREATVLVKDLIAALAGRDADVENTWIIEWRDAITQFGRDLLDVINGAVIPAFKALREVITVVTDAINNFFGTDITAGQIAISAALIQIVGGFRLLRSTIVLAGQALLFFGRLLLANPWIAAITAVAGGILLWVTRTDAATDALEEHQTQVGVIAEEYRKVGGEVAKLGEKVRNELFINTVASLQAAQDAFSTAVSSMQQELRSLLVFTAKDSPFRPIIEDAVNGKADVAEFVNEVLRIGASSAELAPSAQMLLDIAKNAKDLGEALKFKTDFIDLLTGKLTDAEFQARRTGEEFKNIKPPADVAKPLEDTAAAAGAATENVKELGRQITVTRFGEEGMTKEVFDVVDGIARRAEQGKAALDGVGQSATQAGQTLEGVSNEITNSVRDAVPPDAAQAGVDQVISDVEQIVPAAQQVAGDANAALSDIGNVNASGAEAAARAIVTPFETVQQRIGQIFAGIRQVAQNGFSSIATLVRQLAQQIQAEIERIIAALRRAAAEAARLRSQTRSSGRDESGGPGFAAGGHVRGAGSGTSDSILAWLSNGEYVMTARTVRRLGVGFLDALNRGLLPSIKGFSFGGVVDGVTRSMASGLSIPRFADGGLNNLMPAGGGAAGSSVTLVIDRQAFGPLWGPAETIHALTRFARSDAMQSAGRKPGRK